MAIETIRYTKDGITVLWKPKVCIHSGVCVRGLPSVFNPQKKPWIEMDGATLEAIVAQVKKCPSGALSIEEKQLNMELDDIVTIDKAINNGKPVFKGTRVPVHSLFCHLAEGLTLESFISLFPEVDKSQAELLLKLTGKIFSKETITQQP